MKKVECNVSNNILAGFDKCGISPINEQKVLERLPSYAPELAGYKEVIDETVLLMLREMRYGRVNTQSNNKKKKLVVAGRSVENVDKNTEIAITNEIKTEYYGGVKTIIEDNGVKTDAIEKREKRNTKEEEMQKAASVNQKNDKGVKTLNKSLLKKTKIKKETTNLTKTYDKYVKTESNILKKYNETPVYHEKLNPIICSDNLNTFVKNASQQNILTEIIENRQFSEDVDNMDIMNVNLDTLPLVVFEDYLTIPEVEVTSSENPPVCKEKENTKETAMDRNNKIKIISDKIVNLKPGLTSKVKKVNRKYYKTDAEILQALMDDDVV